MLKFKPIDIMDREIFNKLLKCTQYENSEFSFANIFIWKDIYDIKLCINDDVIYISSTIPETGRYTHFQPIFNDENVMDTVLENIKEDEKKHGEEFCISSANKWLVELINKRNMGYDIVEVPEMHDYVYLTSDLSELVGKKYHKKRTHINHFLNKYDYEYQIIDDSNKDDCLIIFDKWAEQMGEDFKKERSVIENAISNTNNLELFGAIIYINGKPAAFAIAEGFLEDTALIHIEKAVPEYREVYTLLNNEFAKREINSKYEYINREEDMGIEGIRRAKKSYHPIKMIKKFDVYEKSN